MLPLLHRLTTQDHPGPEKRPRVTSSESQLFSHISNLPEEIRLLIMTFVQNNNCMDLGRLCKVSRQFDEICKSQEFWRSLLEYKRWLLDWDNGDDYRRQYATMCTMRPGCRQKLLMLTKHTTVLEPGYFQDEDTLNLVNLPPNLKIIHRYAFDNCSILDLQNLPKTVVRIGLKAFENCAELVLQTLPPKLQLIEEFAFNMCPKLNLRQLPLRVTAILEGAFMDCFSLALTELPPNLNFIGAYAFMNCTSLALVDLPASVRVIGTNAFIGCDHLKNTLFGEKVLRIRPDAFD